MKLLKIPEEPGYYLVKKSPAYAPTFHWVGRFWDNSGWYFNDYSESDYMGIPARVFNYPDIEFYGPIDNEYFKRKN